MHDLARTSHDEAQEGRTPARDGGDATLLADAIGRDFATYDGAIRSALARRPIQEADREDCLQDVWCEVLASRFRRFRGGDLRAWLATIARHRAADVMRRAGRRPALGLPGDVAADAPEARPPVDEARALVWSTLAELETAVSPLSLLVFVLHQLEGWRFGEIGATLGLTAPQARLRHHRVKQKFHDLVCASPSGSRDSPLTVA